MQLDPTLVTAALMVAVLAAPASARPQDVVEWSAASGALPGDVAPQYALWQVAPCGAPAVTLAGGALTVDTSACMGQVQSYQYVRSPATPVTYPSVHWAEARVRLHPPGPGAPPSWGTSLSLYPGATCPYALTLREDEVTLGTFGVGILGSIAVDTTTAPRTWRIEVDDAALEVRVILDGQVVLVVPPAAGNFCSFAPGFFGGVHFGDLSQGMAGSADWYAVRHNLGVPVQQFCSLPALNSAGRRARLEPTGSLSIGLNDLGLTLLDAPPSVFGYVLCSRTRGVPRTVAGSQGILCLGAAVGRFNRPGEIVTTDASGTASLALNILSLPQPSGAVPVLAGERWSFQLWYRDTNPSPTSNLSSGLELRFEP